MQKDGISENSLLYFSGCPTGGSGTTYNLSLQFFKDNEVVRTYRDIGNGVTVNTKNNYDQILVKIYVAPNLTVDNLVFKPQLEQNISATEFETPATNPTTPLDIISLGDKTKNLILYPYQSKTNTTNGVTWTDNGDGSITASGTPTGYTSFVFSNVTLTEGQSYILSLYMKDVDNCNNVCYECIISKSDNTTRTITLTKNNPYIIITAEQDEISLGSSIKRINQTNECTGTYSPQVEVCNDLLLHPYLSNTKTENGITFTRNDDGSININGTSTGTASFILQNDITPQNFDKNKKYMLKVSENNTDILGAITLYKDSTVVKGFTVSKYSSLDFSTYDFDRIYCYIYITAGQTIDSVTVKPEFYVLENEPLNYKIPVISHGKNVFDITKCSNYDSTKNGIYMSESISRYAGQGRVSKLTNMIAGKTYVISAESSYSTGHFVYFNGSNRVIQWGTPFIPTQKDIDGNIFFYKHTESTPPDDNAKNVTITNVQIEEGLTATDYEPYQLPIETNIYLKDPLRKSKDFADYIDFANSKIIRNIDEVKFTGTENWQMATSGSLLGMIYLGRSNTAQQTNYGYCSHFPFGTNTYATDSISWWYVNNVIRVKQMRENDENVLYKDAAEFKAFLQGQNAAGTPVTALIPRTTPSEESIVGLPKIPTLKGTTIISIPSELIVSTAKAKYYINS